MSDPKNESWDEHYIIMRDVKNKLWDDYYIKRLNFLSGNINMGFLREIFLDGIDAGLKQSDNSTNQKEIDKRLGIQE